ncbi:MAG: hypothetical protein HY781_09150 [Chloroflexi bacterium]|nr:hypothetical protein [Chloroflexota bacterium]
MTSKKIWQTIVFFVVLTTLFALAYNQSPLYTSNQYQYFLHGLARAGLGTLVEDWMATTLDPTPLFSLLVEITARVHAEGLFYVYYALLMGVYLFSVIGIVETIFPVRKSALTFVVFLTGMILLHSVGLRYLLSRGLGPDWIYLFEGGVAGQRLLGPVFQPSVFGVFLLLSIFLYLRRKPVWAVLSAVFASTVHPTYLLSAAVLVLTFLVDIFFLEHRNKQAVWLGLLSLAVVTPILVYTMSVFSGGSPEAATRARDILVNIRIPHHARIVDWFDATVVIKLVLLSGALFLVRRSRMFLLIAMPLGISILFTLVQLASGSLTLALLFPWRLSTWLVPVALAVVIAKLSLRITASPSVRRARALKAVCLGLVTLAVFAGLARSWLEAGEAMLSPARPLQEYVVAHRQPGDIYLIPVKMYDFRLIAGAPAYGDFFSIPYQNEEVIEWYSRFLNADHFYELADCTLLNDLARQGVTHVILSGDFPAECPSLTPVYEDDAYGLFLLNSD